MSPSWFSTCIRNRMTPYLSSLTFLPITHHVGLGDGPPARVEYLAVHQFVEGLVDLVVDQAHAVSWVRDALSVQPHRLGDDGLLDLRSAAADRALDAFAQIPLHVGFGQV